MKAILTYHSIDSTGSVISVSPETFARHVRWMTSGAVTVVALAELLRLPPDRDAVALTFDDAYTNFASEAWPRLNAHGLPATLYVPTGFAGKANTWAELPGGSMPRLPILDWPALGRLREAGVTLGAHTRTHPDLRSLEASALEDEIEGAFDDLRRETGQARETFSYPYGFQNEAAVSVVKQACRNAVTTELRPLRDHDDAHLLPRLDTFYLHGPGRLENYGGWAFREYLGMRSRVRALGQRVRARRG